MSVVYIRFISFCSYKKEAYRKKNIYDNLVTVNDSSNCHGAAGRLLLQFETSFKRDKTHTDSANCMPLGFRFPTVPSLRIYQTPRLSLNGLT